ncbi:MAG: helix-turn-helix domain-containing protein [Polyangiaceae bacterium]|nr:helix-turn-helix domain-containing protein [Polyangiaceae bacterium]
MSALSELAAGALARGDALTALSLAGRLHGASSLLLRGVAYAQLGDVDLARTTLQRCLTAGPSPLEGARAEAALVEIAVAHDSPRAAAHAARASVTRLTRLGDHRNAAMQQLVLARIEVLLGRLAEARALVDAVALRPLAPDLRAVAWLASAELAIREGAATTARTALTSARRTLLRSPHALLSRALSALEAELVRPLARLQTSAGIEAADLFAVERAARDALLVDACRCAVVRGSDHLALARRPVIFRLLRLLAQAWPEPAMRDDLGREGFDVRHLNPSHRARLRVEMGRLRVLLRPLAASVEATSTGYVLRAPGAAVKVLLPLAEDESARAAFLLGDGAAWSTRQLAEHAGISMRTAQRALAALLAKGEVVRVGAGSSLRYLRPGAPLASRMLLLGLVPTV